MNDHIPKGKVAEYMFAAKCMDMGLLPCWPSHEGQPYDVLVDTQHGPQRVQVKSSVKTGDVIHVPIQMKVGSIKRRYTKKDVDFIVLHLFGFDTWYVFPIEDIGRSVRLKPNSPDCKCDMYLDAWDLLKEPLVKKKRRTKGFAE